MKPKKSKIAYISLNVRCNQKWENSNFLLTGSKNCINSRDVMISNTNHILQYGLLQSWKMRVVPFRNRTFWTSSFDNHVRDVWEVYQSPQGSGVEYQVVTRDVKLVFMLVSEMNERRSKFRCVNKRAFDPHWCTCPKYYILCIVCKIYV